MKKKILIVLFFIALGVSYSFTSVRRANASIKKFKGEAFACKYAQCLGTAKSTGNRCKHCVSNNGDSYCWQHD